MYDSDSQPLDDLTTSWVIIDQPDGPVAVFADGSYTKWIPGRPSA